MGERAVHGGRCPGHRILSPGWQAWLILPAVSVRRFSLVPIHCCFSCKAGSPESKLQLSQLLRIRTEGAASFAVSTRTACAALAPGPSHPSLRPSAPLWVTGGSDPWAAEPRLPVPAREFTDSWQPPRPGWHCVSSGSPGPAAQFSQPGSAHTPSSRGPLRLTGEVDHLWAFFFFLQAASVPLVHSWTQSGSPQPAGTLTLSSQVFPVLWQVAELNLGSEPMWSVGQARALAPDRTRIRTQCCHDGPVSPATHSSLGVLVCGRGRGGRPGHLAPVPQPLGCPTGAHSIRRGRPLPTPSPRPRLPCPAPLPPLLCLLHHHDPPLTPEAPRADRPAGRRVPALRGLCLTGETSAPLSPRLALWFKSVSRSPAPSRPPHTFFMSVPPLHSP